MRIVVISASAAKKNPPEYVRSLAKGMESMGHRADIIDVWTGDGQRLPGYEYIAIAAEPISFFSGKISKNICAMLSAASNLTGKKSAAFIKKKGLFSSRALANLMKAMEREGMVVNWSDLLFNAPHAEAMGKRIGA